MLECEPPKNPRGGSLWAKRHWARRRAARRNDPEWNSGNYPRQPTAFRVANVFYGIATSGNPGLPETGAHTRGGRQIARRPFGRTVCGRRERHALPVGCIGRLQPVARPRAYRARLARHQFRETRGHGTTCMAKFWKEQLQEFVATAPRRPFMPGPQSAMHESKAA